MCIVYEKNKRVHRQVLSWYIRPRRLGHYLMFSRVLLPMGPGQVTGTRYNFSKTTRKMPKSALPARTPVWAPALAVRAVGIKTSAGAEEGRESGVFSGTEPGDAAEDDFVHAGEESEEELTQEDYVWVID